MSAVAIGHNGAPPDEIPFMTWVFDLLGSEMTSAEKVVTLAAVILQTGSVQELAEATRLNVRTVERSRARPAREGWLHIPFTGKEGGRGVRRTYKPAHPNSQNPVVFTGVLEAKAGLAWGFGSGKTPAISTQTPAFSTETPVKTTNTPAICTETPVRKTPFPAVEPATQDARIIDSRAQAHFESPLEILPIQGKKEREGKPVSRLERDPAPYMNGIGFVISDRHGLVIPLNVVDNWKRRFTAIPDLEAQMQKLASVILTKGFMHPGWQCPDGWMAGCLAQDNQRSIDNAKVTDAKVNAVSRKTSGPPAHMRRY